MGFIFFLLAGILLNACGNSDDLSALEEKKAFLGDSLKPILTKPKYSASIYTGEALNLDFNNERLGTDDGMKYSCTASGKDCSTLPDGFSLDAATGKLAWGPFTAVGTYELTITGENIAGTDTQVLPLTVTQNMLPALVKIRDQRTDANRTIIITAVNQNKTVDDTIVFACTFDDKVDEAVDAGKSCDALPGDTQKKFDTKTGTLTWTPTNTSTGTYELKITISNAVGSDKQIFPLVVDADPNIPVLTKVESETTVYVGSTFALDFNNERIGSDRGMTYSCRFDSTIDGKVPGSRDCDSLPDSPDSKFDTVTGRLRWGPLVTEGNFEMRVTGENIAGVSEQILVVHVIKNRNPVLTKILDQRINSNRTFTLAAHNTNSDASSGLYYTCFYDRVLDGVVTNGLACDGLNGLPTTKMNNQTGDFAWTPNNAAIGNYEFSIKAINSTGMVEQVFKVIVDPDPDTPVLTKVASSMNAYIGDTLILDFKNEKTGTDAGMNYACFFDTTVDGHVAGTSSCDGLPDVPSTKFSTAAGVLNWGPLATAGTYEILLRGQNAAGLDEEVFVVHVQQNQAPRLNRILDKQLEAGTTFLVTPVNQTALIGDQVTYSCRFDITIDGAVSASANLCSTLPGQPSIKFDTTTGVLNWVPDNTMVGSYEFKIKATNSYGSDEKIFVLVVSPSTAKKVKLGYIRNVSVVTGETVSVDAINTLTNDDTDMSYACYYDAVVDGDVAATLSCDLLPGTPTQKFNPVTGALNWTPSLQSQTELELKIVGTKQGDSDAKTFVVSFATQRFGDVGNSAIVFDPNSWDFGSVAINQTSTAKSVTLTNNSASSIYIGSIVSSNSDFILNWSACPTGSTAMLAQATCIINLSFRPSTSNQMGSALTVRFGKSQATSTDYSSVIGLSGRGVGTLTFAGLQTISAVTHNSLRLNWTATAQAASFLIFQVVNGNLIYLQTLVNTSGTVNSLIMTNLTPSTAYTYRVRATDFVGVVDSNTANVTATTNANQAPSVSSGPASWAVYTGRTISPIDFNDNYSGNDLDRDGDVISYTCVYDNTLDGSVANNASSCSSLVNIDSTNASFNQFTGVFSNWKPSGSALGTNFEFKVTATDFYGASSSTTFTTTVASGSPLITGVSDAVYPGAAKHVGDTLSLDFDNIRFSPYSDTDMSYTCTYKTLNTVDSSAAACSGLSGSFALNAATGVLTWTSNLAAVGAYALTVTGTNLVGSHARTFKVDVAPAIDETHQLLNLNARFAYDSRGGQNSVSTTTSWNDLLTNPLPTSSPAGSFGTLTNFNAATAWGGTNTASSPLALTFDGVDDYVNFSGTSFASTTALHFDAWIYEGVNAAEKVIFSQGNGSEHGMILTDRRLWLGNGTNTGYSTTVLADNPDLYWRFDDISGGTEADSSPNNRTGLTVNATNVTGNSDDAVFNMAGAGVQTLGSGYMRPTSTYTLAANWTIETWFNFPFAGGCAGGWCTLARSNTIGDHMILIQQNNLLLGVYKNNSSVATPSNGFLSSGYSMLDLARGWHHMAAVGTGNTVTFYIDGVAVGTPIAYQPVMDLYYIGGYPGQPFGKMDEFAVYPTALSATRIAAHFNAGDKRSCTYAMNSGYWYHIAGTIDDTSNTGKLFLNGSQVCSFTKSASKVLAGSTTPLTLGRSSVGAGTSWAGKIASLIFYDDASTTNILTNYAATSTLYSPKLPIAPAGLRLWLRADQGLWQNSGRTVAAVATNDPILAWEDQSGTGGDFTVRAASSQTTARPVLTLNALNGKPVVSFDGVDDNLQNTIAYGFPNTIFLVAHYNGSGARGRILSGTGNNWLMGWHAGYWDRFYANGWVYGPSPTTDNTWMIYATDHTNTVQRLFRNNSIISSNSVAGTQGPIGLSLASYGGGSEFSQSEVAEIIVYDRVLSNAERSAIFDYLNARYAAY